MKNIRVVSVWWWPFEAQAICDDCGRPGPRWNPLSSKSSAGALSELVDDCPACADREEPRQ